MDVCRSLSTTKQPFVFGPALKMLKIANGKSFNFEVAPFLGVIERIWRMRGRERSVYTFLLE